MVVVCVVAFGSVGSSDVGASTLSSVWEADDIRLILDLILKETKQRENILGFALDRKKVVLL